MPFFWGTLMREHGSIAGNQALGSSVTLTNSHRFSYPGYSEILLGEAHDDTIKSNDPRAQSVSTVLEELRSRLELTTPQVGVFASWNVFDAIVEHTEGCADRQRRLRAVRLASAAGPRAEPPADGDADAVGLGPPRRLHLPLRDGSPRAGRGRARSISRSARPTTGRTTAATIACSRPTRGPTTYLRELWTWLQADPRVPRPHAPAHHDGPWPRPHEPRTGATTAPRSRARRTSGWRSCSPSMKKRGEWRDHPPLRTESGRRDARRLDGRRLARATAGGRRRDSRELTAAEPPPAAT